MGLLDELHEEARRRFDGLAAELLTLTVSIKSPESVQKAKFQPRAYRSHTVTDADIVGDVVRTGSDKEGNVLYHAVAETGGMMTGLFGAGYRKLDGLARSMAKVHPFSDTATPQFLLEAVFQWVIATRRGSTQASCTEFVLGELERQASERRVMIPISGFYVEGGFSVGSVDIITQPDEVLDTIARRDPERGAKLRADLQGLAVAVTTVFGEPRRAQEIAVERIDLVVGILRCFAPAQLDARQVSRVDRWGYAPERHGLLFLLDNAAAWTGSRQFLIDPHSRFVLDRETLCFLQGIGLQDLFNAIARSTRTDLEVALLQAMRIFGRGALSQDLGERLVWYCAGLESLLLKDMNEPIVQNLSERLAIFTFDEVGERVEAISNVRRVYGLRSRFVHHGRAIEEHRLVTTFSQNAMRFFLRVATKLNLFTSRADLLAFIDRAKLSGRFSVRGQ